MTKLKPPRKKPNRSQVPPNMQNYAPVSNSLLDVMVDGMEFASLVKYRYDNLNIDNEIKRSLKEISDIRKRPLAMYVANDVNPNIKTDISINDNDDLPFTELINSISLDKKDLDLIIVTPGGSGTQVAKFVDKLRPRFDNVGFIIPNVAMSAGTMFAMSGDEIIMTNSSYIGPIDPQVTSKEGRLMPALAILTLIEEIKNRGNVRLKLGLSPDWTDLQILRQIDPKEIGSAINGSRFSIELVQKYLTNYKFKHWITHSTTGNPVTQTEKEARAEEIASKFCNHDLWKTHGRGISREDAWNICRIKITASEDFPGLDRAIKRYWALIYWIFENSGIFKTFVSDNYSLFRVDQSITNPNLNNRRQ